MSIERVFYCDGPECENHARTASDLPPTSFLVVREDADHSQDFCSWDCLLKFAAQKPPTEVIPAGDLYS
jgi:hypothetical protein